MSSSTLQSLAKMLQCLFARAFPTSDQSQPVGRLQMDPFTSSGSRNSPNSNVVLFIRA